MKYLIILFFIGVYALSGNGGGYTVYSPWYTHITYLFQHANVWHLLVNSLSFIGICTALKKIQVKWFLPVSFLIAIIASFPASFETPTVGASSVVYAMVGIYTGATLFDKKIKIADTRKYLLFIGMIFLSLTISFFKPSSNFPLHLYSLLGGGAVFYFFPGLIQVAFFHNHSNGP